MSRELRDAVVVGAGPAGSVTALLLARAGCDVVLVDRASFPRPKPCGDCLSAEATRLLARLGLLPTVLALGPARLDGWRIYGPGGACFSAAFHDLGDGDPHVQHALALPRRDLDQALLLAAAAAGAELRTATLATDLSSTDGAVTGVVLRPAAGGHEQALATRLVVIADGLRSRLAGRLGAVRRRPRIRKLSLTTHLTWSGAARYGTMFAGAGICAGLAPVSAAGDRWNLTVVADADRFGLAARHPREFFRTALRLLPAFPDPDLEPEELLASGPFDRPVAPVAFAGAALVGDAAGYFDPFTGQGIYHALAGGVDLAETVIPLLQRGGRAPIGVAELRPYLRAAHTLASGPRRVQRLIHEVLDRPRLANHAIAALARRPRAAAALLAVTGDVRPAGSLLSPALFVSLLRPDRAGVAG